MIAPTSSNRVRKELANLIKNKPPIVEELKTNGDNERDWTVVLAPDREPFKGGAFKMRFVFGDRYPFQPPIVTFETKVYHPNVEPNTGKMCFTMINPETWRAGVSIRDVIQALNKILAEPELDRPSNPDATQVYQRDKDEYVRLVKAKIQEMAQPPPTQSQPTTENKPSQGNDQPQSSQEKTTPTPQTQSGQDQTDQKPKP